MNRPDKTINLNLVGLDGNAFELLGSFQKQAKREGWTDDEIRTVINAAKAGNYDHLVATLSQYCEPIESDG